MRIVDVARDGNCMFSSVCYQLGRLGICKLAAGRLRNQLAEFMSQNATDYRDFVCARIDSGELCNADTEQPTDEDIMIAGMNDYEVRTKLMWMRYLHELQFGRQWGEHIALQAIADMFSLTIFVHTAQHAFVIRVSSRHACNNEFHLGLMDQYHYVGVTMP